MAKANGKLLNSNKQLAISTNLSVASLKGKGIMTSTKSQLTLGYSRNY
jgi:hypothetical protein